MNRRRRCRRRDPFVPEKQWRLPVINNDLISYLRKGRRFEEIESQPVRESRVPRAPLSLPHLCARFERASDSRS